MHIPVKIFSKSSHTMHTPREKLLEYGGILRRTNNKSSPKIEENPVIDMLPIK